MDARVFGVAMDEALHLVMVLNFHATLLQLSIDQEDDGKLQI